MWFSFSKFRASGARKYLTHSSGVNKEKKKTIFCPPKELSLQFYVFTAFVVFLNALRREGIIWHLTQKATSLCRSAALSQGGTLLVKGGQTRPPVSSGRHQLSVLRYVTVPLYRHIPLPIN